MHALHEGLAAVLSMNLCLPVVGQPTDVTEGDKSCQSASLPSVFLEQTGRHKEIKSGMHR